MNGRVFDPALGRFLSADPFVDDAGDAQSYNRYSYVSNNPLRYTDPSGYFKFKDAVKIVVMAVAAYFTAGAALAVAGGTTLGTGLAAVAGVGGVSVTGAGAVVAGAAGGICLGVRGIIT